MFRIKLVAVYCFTYFQEQGLKVRFLILKGFQCGSCAVITLINLYYVILFVQYEYVKLFKTFMQHTMFYFIKFSLIYCKTFSYTAVKSTHKPLTAAGPPNPGKLHFFQ